MLVSLEIRDILIIEHLRLDFQAGLNVLTGETGAGKSILLDALGFVLGWRGRADLVRQGADQGEVSAVFDLAPDHPAFAVLREAGFPDPDGELLLRRVNVRDGRKSAYVNDRACSGAVLRQLSDCLVEVHGQHDDRGLLDPRGHRDLLDAFGRTTAELKKTGDTWRARQAAAAALEAATERLASARNEEDYLRHAVAELEALAPLAGEEADLDLARRRMQSAEKIRDDVARALETLTGEGAEGQVANAVRWLEGVADKSEGSFDPALSALSRTLVELGDAIGEVERGLDGLDVDPLELERIEERLFALRALARKHDVLPDDLAGLAETLAAQVVALDQGAAQIDVLETALTEADTAYSEASARLSAKRAKAAKALDRAVAGELAPLKMERAVFTTQVSPANPGPQGADAVAFTVAPNPGAPSGALNKIASGGELSRFLLALKVCLTANSTGLTLIFDEIDRGVGGATADAVGRRLKALAEEAQVLVVTHSPQVAAVGAHHWRVEKSVRKDQTRSTVTALSSADRVDEIARMLSGDSVSDAAREAARELLKAG